MNTTTDDRIAILLRMLGKDVTDSVLEQLRPERVATMKASLAELDAVPPSGTEMDDVLDEFQRLLQAALEDEPAGASGGKQARKQPESEPVEPFESTGDPFTDLSLLQSFQIAGALREESASTIAVVLGCLPAERAGDVIQELPQEIRKDVFLKINSPTTVPQVLLAQIVRATVENGCHLDLESTADPEQVADEKLAQVLRSMNRTNRQEMLEALDESDEETAQRVRNLLYVFTDLLVVTDRSIQKLLGGVDTAVLATALANAEQSLVDKITSNLSKRARATLLEEIEFLESVSSEQQEAAEKAICDVLSTLDQAGDLEMME